MYVAREQVLKINWGSTRYVGLVTFNRPEYGIRTQSNKTIRFQTVQETELNSLSSP
jgi:hypothetical protein